MICVYTADDLKENRDIWFAIHRFRHDIFVDEMGWEDLRRSDSLEIDAYDHEGAVHFVMYEDEQICAYIRLLPTVRPHLLSDIMPYLCARERPSGPDIVELTRFALARHCRSKESDGGAIAAMMHIAVVEWGLEHDYRHIVIEFDPRWILTLMRKRFLVNVLGYPHDIGGQEVVAALLSFDEQTLHVMRMQRGDLDPIIKSDHGYLGQKTA